jgi:hypothetical protein
VIIQFDCDFTDICLIDISSSLIDIKVNNFREKLCTYRAVELFLKFVFDVSIYQTGLTDARVTNQYDFERNGLNVIVSPLLLTLCSTQLSFVRGSH